MARLGDICKIQSGGTPSRAESAYWDNGSIPWVKISDIKDKYLNDTEEYITEAGLENSSAKIFPAGTILYTIFATLGEVCILNMMFQVLKPLFDSDLTLNSPGRKEVEFCD